MNRITFRLVTLATALIADGIRTSAAQDTVAQHPLNVSRQIVETACGQCQFGMPGEGCTLAIRIDGSSFFVEGSLIDDHGDAHAPTGLCNCIRDALVEGHIANGRFVAATMHILPRDNEPPKAPSAEEIFKRVWSAVDERFYRSDFNGVDWALIRDEFLPRAIAAEGRMELADIINQALGRLQTSHTNFFTVDDVEYYFLADIFSAGPLGEKILPHFARGVVSYEGIGVFARQIDGQWFVAGTPHGGPAAQAGLRRGQRIVAVDGQPFHPIRSFDAKADKPVEMTIQSTPDTQSQRTLKLTPISIRPQAFMLDAMKASMRLIEAGNKRIGYVRIWSYAGSQFQDALIDAITDGALKDADVLIIDLRDGWGGADPEYLQLFNQTIPRMTTVRRDGTTVTRDTHWRKPCALLINEGTRSGKELIAYGFKKSKLGPVVGSRTAGAVTAGTLIPVSSDSMLYLAVAGIEVDGEVLEGRGVEPDYNVPWDLPYAGENDPQLQKAIELLTH